MSSSQACTAAAQQLPACTLTDHSAAAHLAELLIALAAKMSEEHYKLVRSCAALRAALLHQLQVRS